MTLKVGVQYPQPGGPRNVGRGSLTVVAVIWTVIVFLICYGRAISALAGARRNRHLTRIFFLAAPRSRRAGRFGSRAPRSASFTKSRRKRCCRLRPLCDARRDCSADCKLKRIREVTANFGERLIMIRDFKRRRAQRAARQQRILNQARFVFDRFVSVMRRACIRSGNSPHGLSTLSGT
jgi:hypothetical protein